MPPVALLCLGEVRTPHVWFASGGDSRDVDITTAVGELLCLLGNGTGTAKWERELRQHGYHADMRLLDVRNKKIHGYLRTENFAAGCPMDAHLSCLMIRAQFWISNYRFLPPIIYRIWLCLGIVLHVRCSCFHATFSPL